MVIPNSRPRYLHAAVFKNSTGYIIIKLICWLILTWHLYREAFAAWLPPFGVPLSYAIAIAYVLVDTADKGIRAYKDAGIELDGVANLSAEVNKPRYI